MKKLPVFITGGAIAKYIDSDGVRGVSRQRANFMLRNPGQGDNEQRIREALQRMADELKKYLSPM